jgi:hypothetical protein
MRRGERTLYVKVLSYMCKDCQDCHFFLPAPMAIKWQP